MEMIVLVRLTIADARMTEPAREQRAVVNAVADTLERHIDRHGLNITHMIVAAGDGTITIEL